MTIRSNIVASSRRVARFALTQTSLPARAAASRGGVAGVADSRETQAGRGARLEETDWQLVGRYEDICAEHVWRVPDRYNIAADCCDKHPPDKLAMVHERFDGQLRDLTWGELQDLSNQAANLLEAHGVERGDRVAVVLPPTPEAAAIFFGTWKLTAILLSMSVLYGNEGIAHRL